MALSAYVDESGTFDRESPVVVLAGFVSDAQSWSRYELDVEQVFLEFNVSTFHAKRLRSGSGDFSGWTRGKKARFRAKMLEAANNNLKYGMASICFTDMYERYYRKASALLKMKGTLDSQYGVCLRMLIWKAIVLFRDKKEEWPIHFILESGHKNAGDAVRIFHEEKGRLKPEYDGLLGRISFDDKLDCKPLSAPDFLAHSAFRDAAKLSRGERSDVISVGETDPPKFLVSKVEMSKVIVERDTLRDMLMRIT